ncbi:transcriptional regulator [Mycolicibacterium moriokaense]|uniref:Transcriptional regulator n=1 Tax=Mycolicibacterium moriokaense TaxID=39691 RepID=A0AAD1HI72_9MYCO|nr:helix-turn-helix domain-containing protein [Mycolicibacterium moriokaense]MCV7042406.1 helix-turn-helix transcriptional regulator [Mycolicibacterium moriokaense]ORB22991.1 transcriptional regulator [Mycolicibacterium moriokaense]BBX05184.1 transcriptional regulator [Mycolicibacterium moriokaense]
MLDVEVITDPAAAVSVLDPIRNRLLAELTEPASAAALASRLGISRQKVNYHLRALEDHHLVMGVGERRWGGLKERLLVATAASYVVSPSALGRVATDPSRCEGRLSASYLIALSARAVREVGEMWSAARSKNNRPVTLSIDRTIRFRSPEDRAEFAKELATLAARYHDETDPDGRRYRLVAMAYPMPTDRA